jgi:O-antigen/teichoic acid export membrane protein
VSAAHPTDSRPGGEARAGTAMLLVVGGGFLTQLLMTVTGVLSARMLGVEGRGQVVLVASLSAMTAQLFLGGSLPNAITKMLADRRVTARDGLHPHLVRWTLWGLLTSAVAGGYFLVIERSTDGNTKFALAVAVVIMAIQNMASRILVGAMLGEGTDLVHVAMTSVLPQGLVTVALATAYGLGVHWNAVELSAVTIICVTAVLAGRLRLLRKPTRRRADQLDRFELRRLAAKTYIGSVGPIDGLSIDRTLVGSLLGSVALGLYSVAFALAGLTMILGRSLASLILPRVARAQVDPRTEKYVVRAWLLFSAVLIAAVVLMLEVTTHLLVRALFGAEFIGAVAVTHWLVAAAGFLDFRRVLIAVLQGRDRGLHGSVIELALTPFVVGGIVWASTRDSLVGVGQTMLVAGVISCLALSVAVLRSAPAHRYEPAHRYRRKSPTRMLTPPDPTRPRRTPAQSRS